jgi:hypothetical protein
MDTQAHRAQLNNLWAAFQKGMADSENSWQILPDRLRGRGDWLKQRGRIKDAELMYDAACEIEGLRGLKG